MSTPEQPATPALTRKQLRDLRNTGATPVASDASADPESASDLAGEATEPDDTAAPVSAPLPRAAVPAPVRDQPAPDASVDLDATPLTRRQARQQERIRTASVPVITPEIAAAHAASVADAAASPVETAEAERDGADEVADQNDSESADAVLDLVAVEGDADEDGADKAVVSPQLGAGLLAGAAVQPDLPPSFDQLISRSVTGSIGTGNALILSQTPSAPNLVAPVTATGEVLITGSFNLPEGLGSTGHADGTADGKDVDAVLVDGELPAHSSPTPIAASAAISTVKNDGDIIKPPTPEKGGRLMLTLAITAGVLALALVGVLILAFVTGVF
ncbi:hypothetical protein NQ152_09695 [Microbacterium sp. zg.B48]|uniref:hypothetical protein n=1 Tax=Microbacterium sp. zg.B48 TaxID=2969408 RepID=UPI00214C5198|nr:hypothetical protein [Microbacterium sp. zg.B48]MCR2763780.1 hypothetical protein [Microbacterium sp. zg.B48]